MTSGHWLFRHGRKWLGTALLACGSLFAAQVHASLIGDTVTVALTGTGIGLDTTDTLAVTAGVEFAPNGTAGVADTNLGANMLAGAASGERIDIGAYSIFLHLKGDDYGTGAYTAGFASTAMFVFSGLDIANETITGISVSASGVTASASVVDSWFTLDSANQISFAIGLVEFAPTQPDTFGDFTITLTTRGNGTPPGPNPTPEPGSLALAGLALAALGWARRGLARTAR
ncbi:MAG: hypothetical protein C0505_00570 [Leptothrix sp. (in: Bacteria)]|nr:hypothetical protein [Leptothrix sp. (in: b-proteobacteria)]